LPGYGCFVFRFQPGANRPVLLPQNKAPRAQPSLVKKIWIGSKEFLDRRNEEKTQRRRAVSNEQ
jgi:hypothetical protein